MCWHRGKSQYDITDFFFSFSSNPPRLYFDVKVSALRAPMFNGSSNITIEGGTFIVVNGNLYQADCVSQFTGMYPLNHKRGRQNTSWEEFSEPEAYSTPGCHSAASLVATGHAFEQVAKHNPIPSTYSEPVASSSPHDDNLIQSAQLETNPFLLIVGIANFVSACGNIFIVANTLDLIIDIVWALM